MAGDRLPAYAIARLHGVVMGPEIVAYLERIDATLAPFGGRFLIHGGLVDLLEGEWRGRLIVIAFPDRERAHAWYGSQAYQDILPLRTRHAKGNAILIEGVGDGHRANDILMPALIDRAS